MGGSERNRTEIRVERESKLGRQQYQQQQVHWYTIPPSWPQYTYLGPSGQLLQVQLDPLGQQRLTLEPGNQCSFTSRRTLWLKPPLWCAVCTMLAQSYWCPKNCARLGCKHYLPEFLTVPKWGTEIYCGLIISNDMLGRFPNPHLWLDCLKFALHLLTWCQLNYIFP